jgi:hypothetical protein
MLQVVAGVLATSSENLPSSAQLEALEEARRTLRSVLATWYIRSEKEREASMLKALTITFLARNCDSKRKNCEEFDFHDEKPHELQFP